MAVSPLNEIERQFSGLPPESQLSLLERLVHHLRQSLVASPDPWAAELAAMAADPQIQNELRRIDAEFSSAEADGLGQS